MPQCYFQHRLLHRPPDPSKVWCGASDPTVACGIDKAAPIISKSIASKSHCPQPIVQMLQLGLNWQWPIICQKFRKCRSRRKRTLLRAGEDSFLLLFLFLAFGFLRGNSLCSFLILVISGRLFLLVLVLLFLLVPFWLFLT